MISRMIRRCWRRPRKAAFDIVLAEALDRGKSAGGLCYDYKPLRQTDAQGEAVGGDRAIDERETQIINRIFRMFAEGHSPVAIAKALNAEALPGPEGRAWRDTTIRGHAARGTGILRNELYIGRLIWNCMRFIKDPTTDTHRIADARSDLAKFFASLFTKRSTFLSSKLQE
jgi:hypothetical protein